MLGCAGEPRGMWATSSGGNMDEQAPNIKMVEKLMFRLLPVQVLLCMVGLVNALVSSFFASNFVGIAAMSAVGLYGPLNMLVTSVSTVLVGGSAIICGRYLGENRQEKLQGVFTLTIVASVLIALVFILVIVTMGAFDLTGVITGDPEVRPLLNSYLLGQAIGILPLMLGNSLASFLSLENRAQRTLVASIGFIVANLVLNFLFVQVLHLEAFGLSLASSLGLWVFLGVQAPFFLSGQSRFGLALDAVEWRETLDIVRIGLPGAAGNLYQTARGLIVNNLLNIFVGSVGISAFAAANNLLGIFWAIPGGMLAVSRMVISVSVGEEDRQTLTDVMRVMFRRFIPLMCAIRAAIVILAVPLAGIFYKDPSEPVFMMTV